MSKVFYRVAVVYVADPYAHHTEELYVNFFENKNTAESTWKALKNAVDKVLPDWRKWSPEIAGKKTPQAYYDRDDRNDHYEVVLTEIVPETSARTLAEDIKTLTFSINYQENMIKYGEKSS